MPDILYAPNREQVVTTNAWAFLHWLRTMRGVDLPDWAALQRWSVSDRGAFGRGDRGVRPIAGRAAAAGAPLGAAGGTGSAARWWRAVGLTRDGVRAVGEEGDGRITPGHDGKAGRGGRESSLPADVATPLTRLWPPALLIRPLADLLLHADLRPDDRLLVAGSAAWPWLAALLEGTTVILAAAAPATLLATAADEARHRPRRPRADPRRGRLPARAPPPGPRPTCARSSPPAGRSRRRAARASTPGSSRT